MKDVLVHSNSCYYKNASTLALVELVRGLGPMPVYEL